MQAYNSYIESDVDWVQNIPSHWDIKKFKYLFRIKKNVVGELGHSVLSITQKGIKIKDVESGGGQVASDYSKYQKVSIGDYAMNHMDLLTGFVDLSPFDGVTSPDYRVFELIDLQSEKRFYLYILQLCYAHKIFYPLGQGAAHVGRWRLPADAFNEFKAPKPSLPEQREIVGFLDRETARIDNLIAEKQTFINLLKEKRQALISHVVTKGLDPNVKMKGSGIEWIGEVPEYWECVPLKRLIRNIEQGWSPECHSNPAKEDCWGVLKSGAVNGGVYQAQENKELPENLLPRPEIEVKDGDLIMSRASGSRELIGSAAYVYETRSKLMLSDKLFRLNYLDEINPEFVSICLGSYPLRRQIELAIGGAEGLANNLSQSNIKRLFLAKPPKAEQDLIVSALKKRLEGFDRIVAETSRSIELLREHRTALISSAVTGKIDVRNCKEKAA